MSTNTRFYTMVGIYLTEKDIDKLEDDYHSLSGDDEEVNIVDHLERLCDEYNLTIVSVDPMMDSSCVIGHVLFESDGWDDAKIVSFKEVTAIQAIPIMKFMNVFSLMITEHPIQYHTFVQVG